jgi:hypothetical protein
MFVKEFNSEIETFNNTVVPDEDRVKQQHASISLTADLFDLVQELVQQFVFVARYFMTADFSNSPIGSYVYSFSKWSLSWTELIDQANLKFSLSLLFLWFIICSLLPLISFWLVDAPLPTRFLIQKNPEEGETRCLKSRRANNVRRFVVFSLIIIGLLGTYIGLDRAFFGASNSFTYACAVLAVVAFLFVCGWVYFRYASRYVRKNALPKLRNYKQKLFVTIGMVSQGFLFDELVGVLGTYPSETFLGVYTWIVLITVPLLLTFFTFKKWIDNAMEVIFGSEAPEDPEVYEQAEDYARRIDAYPSAYRKLYDDFRYRGRYTELFDLVHRFVLFLAELLPQAELVIVMTCAVFENLYVLIWWPEAGAIKIWPRALGGFGHFFLALDALLCKNEAISPTGSFVIGKVLGLVPPGIGMAVTCYAFKKDVQSLVAGDDDAQDQS